MICERGNTKKRHITELNFFSTPCPYSVILERVRVETGEAGHAVLRPNACFAAVWEKAMRLTTLTKTNIFVGMILLTVSLSLSGIYYYSFFKDSMESFRQNSMLKMSYIYSRLSPFFIQPVSVSKAMAKDILLVSFLLSDNSPEKFEKIITNYLKGYKNIYDFDGAFLTTLNNNNF